jgi:hypothetical protein
MNDLIVRPAIMGALPLAATARRCRASIFTCEPKYRILRFVRTRAAHCLRHARLSRLLQAQWQIVRSHSSWSRA